MLTIARGRLLNGDAINAFLKETVTDYSRNDLTIVPVSSYLFEKIEEGTVSLKRADVKVAFDAIRSDTGVIIVPVRNTKAHAGYWSVVAICCKARCTCQFFAQCSHLDIHVQSTSIFH